MSATKISVIMPCTLQPFTGAARGRKRKLMRAVKSFRMQTWEEKELIIVSDGCTVTERIYERHYSKVPEIKFVKIDQQPLFSGNVRQASLDAATGSIIAFLDADDYHNFSHLENIVTKFQTYNLSWAYFDDYIKRDEEYSTLRNVILEQNKIGVSSIAFSSSMNVSWTGCDGWGHEWRFIQKLRAADDNYRKIYGCGYTICHLKDKIDF